MSESFDPYHKWLGIPPNERPANHYRLLGIVDYESDPDVIESAADQRMAHLRRFQCGQHASHSQTLLNELSKAQHCLLDPAKKAAYDQQLSSSDSTGRTLSSPAPTTRPAPRTSDAEQLQTVPMSRPKDAAEKATRRPQPAHPQTPMAKTSTPSSSTPSLLDTAHDVPPRSPQERGSALEVLRREVAQCTRCAELADSRTQTVFGVGNPQARLCFLGEAPGADEDRQGEPFVGRAGQLLTKIIEACTLHRQDVYILNVLKCRPPGNRSPSSDEAAHCRGFLERQLEIIQPQYICCLGTVAAQNLLATTQSIGRLRRRFHDYQGIKVMATYHPAYLLRNPAAKRDVWEDMQMLMEEMGIELPQQTANPGS